MPPRNTFAATRRSHTILKWLQSGREVRIQHIMEEFEIQYPQARADLKLLEELYGLSTHRDGRTKVWTWSGIDSDHVDVATVAALELGAISLDIFKDTPYGNSIQRLTDYCKRRVPEDHRDRLERLSSGLHLRRTWLPTRPESILEHIESILNALYVAEPRWLFAEYERSDGELSEYLLLPRRLVWYQGRLWLLALDRYTLKLFDVAGFRNLERYRASEHGARYASGGGDGLVEDGGVAHPVEFSDEKLEGLIDELHDQPSTYFEHAFGIYAGNFPVESIHLEVRGRWRSYMRRYQIHPSQTTEPDEETLHVRFEMAICPEFKSFLMGMIPDVEIHAPDDLREELRRRMESWLDDRQQRMPHE